MASGQGKRSGAKRSSSGRTSTRTTASKKRQSGSRAYRPAEPMDSAIKNEVILIGVFALAVFLFLCNFGIVGVVGDTVSDVMFGLLGIPAYIAPVMLFLAVAFGISNKGNRIATRKLAAAVILFVLIGMTCDLTTGAWKEDSLYSVHEIYERCSENHTGGGILMGTLAFLSFRSLSMVGTVLLLIVLAVICLIILTEKSIVKGVKSGGQKVYERTREETYVRRERAQQRRKEQEELRRKREEERRIREEEMENEKILRMDKKVSGVMLDTVITAKEEKRMKRGDGAEAALMTGAAGIAEVSAAAETSAAVKTAALAETAAVNKAAKEVAVGGAATKSAAVDTTVNGGANTAARMPADISPHATAAFSDEIRDDIHEIILSDLEEDSIEEMEVTVAQSVGGFHSSEYDKIHITANGQTEGAENGAEMGINTETGSAREESAGEPYGAKTDTGKSHEEGSIMDNTGDAIKEESGSVRVRPTARLAEENKKGERSDVSPEIVKDMKKSSEGMPKQYRFPSLNLLKKGENKGNAASSMQLKETAINLQNTLATFGVKVTITDISQGPTVTRYELQPEKGVKVSKIVGLADDIKLNLAATDIRIEAPIPGKAAVGIEVPNKENFAVPLRDLLESKEFQEFPSNLAFAVGKDIGGKTVVTDIARMPHMLIAGSTGSGKSVCINTLIMSILYKAHPDDVKLIMVDPKVVELSVYNGIPHLLIPVVTDPKKAAAALHWGVAEMTDRYKKFADFNVRDLKGYNKAVEAMKERGEDAPVKMPQIVIIVDELADLMMVSPGEVEESICRLAQLARAAGIHLIIATQRPSVDVITGLIKANMPSRVAFAVSSGVDSRTILDMNGAEKLLGKGDMLFYPQGYPKPARVQGSFVSDSEVSDVVDFLKNQAIGNVYSEDVQEKIQTIGTGTAPSSGGGSEESSKDQYFAEAGKFIIEKDKASIGMLQRVFKIGFNRAARIMDQLCEAGVVGEEEGTKPRKVLMSMEEFERILEEEV
ncbi:MAG: DNA translocase FtsK [Lachnospiraceae bacterium]|nr:DNA translocase FtsK [Lachnospiraceae bacterium]